MLSVARGDCLIFDFKNPYSAPDSYSSFPSFKNNQSTATNCTVSLSSLYKTNSKFSYRRRMKLTATFCPVNAYRSLSLKTTPQER